MALNKSIIESNSTLASCKIVALNKIARGENLDRQDLDVICHALTENLPKGTYYEAAAIAARAEEEMFPVKIQGYKKIGKKSEGKSKQGINYSLLERNIRITEDYEKLTDKNNEPHLNSGDAIKKLASESLKRYGSSVGERVITDALTEGRKAISVGMTSECGSIPAF